LFETDTGTNIFKNIVTDIWPVADIRLAIHTNIPKFAYQYFIEVFWLKLVAYGSLIAYHSPNSELTVQLN